LLEPLTLDQLTMFVTVARAGSFSGAAQELGRVQSAVSYNVRRMEEALDVQLFDRSTRRPALTPAGRTLLAEAEAVLGQASRLRAVAAGLASHLEPQVTVALDGLYPPRAFASLARAFRAEFPTIPLLIRGGMLGVVVEHLRAGRCQFGVTGREMVELAPDLATRPCLRIDMIAVASPSHPLAQTDALLDDHELADHVHLVMTDPTALTGEKDWNVASPRTWRVDDPALRNAAILAGTGWGRVPRWWAEPLIRDGQLVELQLRRWDGRVPSVDLHVAWRTSEPPGPAATWLLTRLAAGGTERT
jgi:DNA-binding transcriptional LysR family regulator